jgi:hypothetical protein
MRTRTAICPGCEPSYFVVYRYCRSCQRKCNPALYDPAGNISLKEYKKNREKWENNGNIDMESIKNRCTARKF